MEHELPRLVVGTFNIRGWTDTAIDGENAWPYRASLTVKTIEDMHPDILGLQEVSGTKNRAFYSYNLTELETHAGRFMDDDAYNPVVFRRDKLVIETNGTETIFLSSDGEPHPDWGAGITRSANMVVFRAKESGTLPTNKLIFVNLHLDNKNEPARVEGTKKIIRRLERVPRETPVVVVGDFNSSFYSPIKDPSYSGEPHRLFLAEGFTDAFQAVNPNQRRAPHTFHNFEGDAYQPDQYGTWHTDWILSRGVTPVSYEIVRTSQPFAPFFPSDHYPVKAVVTK